jgi:hypothetical protein
MHVHSHIAYVSGLERVELDETYFLSCMVWTVIVLLVFVSLETGYICVLYST